MHTIYILIENKNERLDIVNPLLSISSTSTITCLDCSNTSVLKITENRPSLVVISHKSFKEIEKIATRLLNYDCKIPLVAVTDDVTTVKTTQNIRAIVKRQDVGERLTKVVSNILSVFQQKNEFYHPFDNPLDITESFVQLYQNEMERRKNLSLDKHYSCVAVIDSDIVQTKLDLKQFNMMLDATVKHIANWNFDDFQCTYLVRNEHVVLLIQSDKALVRDFVARIVTSLLKDLQNSLQSNFSIGLSPLNSPSKDYKKLHDLAIESLDFRRVLGGNRVIFHDELPDDKIWVVPLEPDAFKQLAVALHTSSCIEMHNLLTELLEVVSQKRYHACCHYIRFNLFMSILNACDSPNILSKNYLPQNQLFIQFVRIKTREETNSFIRMVANEVYRANQQVKQNSLHKNYMNIIHYIEHNYSDSTLDLNKLSNALGLSISYISALLKKHDTSFVKYLTDLRIEQAKLMLRNNQRLITDISESVGYSDPYYFSHCFKKATGMSPRAYKQKILRINN